MSLGPDDIERAFIQVRQIDGCMVTLDTRRHGVVMAVQCPNGHAMKRGLCGKQWICKARMGTDNCGAVFVPRLMERGLANLKGIADGKENNQDDQGSERAKGTEGT